MANISISFDTISKKMTATKDGVEIPSVCGAYLGRCYNKENATDDDFRLEVMSASQNTDGTSVYTRLIASESKDGFVVAEDAEKELYKDIVDYFTPETTKLRGC